MSEGLSNELAPFKDILMNMIDTILEYAGPFAFGIFNLFATLPLAALAFLFILATFLYLLDLRINKIFSWPYRKTLIILRRIGFIKDKRTWGVVYDSVTKFPIDPAIVTVNDRLGKVMATAITDLDGRFGVILPPGEFRLKVEKTNYTFPSMRLLGKATDGYFSDLYFGTWFNVTSFERSVAFAVPMDPQKRDWNQEEKSRLRITANDRDEFRMTGKIYFFFTGIILLSKYLVYKQDLIEKLLIIYLFIFLAVAIFRAFMPRNLYHSVVIDEKNNEPLAFAKIKIFNEQTKRQVSVKTTSINGQFVCLIPNGKYFVTIEKRNENAQYTLVKTSEPFEVIDRSINRKFVV